MTTGCPLRALVLLEHPLTTTKDTTVNARRRSNLCLPHITCESQTQGVSLAPTSTSAFSTTTGGNTSDTRVNANTDRTFAFRTSPTSHKHGVFPRTTGLQIRPFEQTKVNAGHRSILRLPHTIYKHRVFPATTGTPTTPQSINARRRSNLCLPHITYESQTKIVSGNHRLGEGRTCAYSHHLLLTLP